MYQCVHVAGNVGKDAVVKFLPNGDAVAQFSVAASEKFKDKTTGELREIVEWFNIDTFGKQAEFAGKHCRKGAVVLVTGKMRTRKWEDKSGVMRYTTTLRADEIKMMKWAQDREDFDGDSVASDAPSQQPKTPPSSGGSFADFEDDIPF